MNGRREELREHQAPKQRTPPQTNGTKQQGEHERQTTSDGEQATRRQAHKPTSNPSPHRTKSQEATKNDENDRNTQGEQNETRPTKPRGTKEPNHQQEEERRTERADHQERNQANGRPDPTRNRNARTNEPKNTKNATNQNTAFFALFMSQEVNDPSVASR